MGVLADNATEKGQRQEDRNRGEGRGSHSFCHLVYSSKHRCTFGLSQAQVTIDIFQDYNGVINDPSYGNG